MVDKRKYNASIERIPMPARIATLPIDARGYPVPWFVQYLKDGKESTPEDGGEPDFRVMNSKRLVLARNRKLCWTCGQPMGQFYCFVIGPMCAINRVSAEPPSHLDCGQYAAKACPFLSNPRMRRNEKNLPEHKEMAGFGIERNPGVTCLWVTRNYDVFMSPAGGQGPLFKLGKAHSVAWYAQGRVATREEVMASIDSGYPALEAMAAHDGQAGLEALARQRAEAMRLVPA